jgi:hypothetical protein
VAEALAFVAGLEVFLPHGHSLLTVGRNRHSTGHVPISVESGATEGHGYVQQPAPRTTQTGDEVRQLAKENAKAKTKGHDDQER